MVPAFSHFAATALQAWPVEIIYEELPKALMH